MNRSASPPPAPQRPGPPGPYRQDLAQPPAHGYPPPGYQWPPPGYGGFHGQPPYPPPGWPPQGYYQWQYPPRVVRPPGRFVQTITSFFVTLGFTIAHLLISSMALGIFAIFIYLALGGSIGAAADADADELQRIVEDVLFGDLASSIISTAGIIIAFAVGVAVTWLLIRYTWLSPPSRRINFSLPGPAAIGCIVKYTLIQTAVFVGFVLLGLLISDAGGFGRETETPLYQITFPSLVFQLSFGIVVVSMLVPFIEEVIFRGVFYKALRKSFRFWPAFLVSGIFFVLLHYRIEGGLMLNLYIFSQLMALTYFMTLGYEKTRNLWVPISLHALHNLRVVIIGLIFVITGWDSSF